MKLVAIPSRATNHDPYISLRLKHCKGKRRLFFSAECCKRYSIGTHWKSAAFFMEADTGELVIILFTHKAKRRTHRNFICVRNGLRYFLSVAKIDLPVIPHFRYPCRLADDCLLVDLEERQRMPRYGGKAA